MRAILLIDHGSRRAESNESLRVVARHVQDLAGDDVFVACAHMDIASPAIAEAVDACVEAGAVEIVAVPYLLAPGRHATEDIPRLVAEAVTQHSGVSHRVTAPLGPDPALAALVIARVEG